MKKIFLLLALAVISCSDNETLEENKSPQSTSLSALQKTDQNFLPINLGPNFIFGINGHPYTQPPYTQISKQTQINKIKELGCSYYRVDINPETTNPDIATFTNAGIKILPVLIFLPQYNLALTQQYATGQALGEQMYSKAGNCDYYEVGNELDLTCLDTIKGEGFEESHYFPDKINKLAEMYRGIINTLKTKNPSCKIIINNAGWVKFKYFKLLLDKNVNFDVIGTHWYSNMGQMSTLEDHYGFNILEQLETYEKPIWITEVNYGYQNPGNPLIENQRAQWLINFIHDINNNHPKVESLFIYEMYDQSSHTTDPDESTFGIIGEQIPENGNGAKKLRCDVLKYKSEENKHGYEDYIWRVYNKALGVTTPVETLINFYGGQLKNHQNKNTTLSSLLSSTEYYNKYIKELYLKIHNREATSSDLTYWTNQMSQGMTRENVCIEFCKSTEFQTLPVGPNQNNNNTLFINKLFDKLLGRPADITGINYWVSELNNGVSKTSVINSFIHGAEFYDKFIISLYENILNSTPTTNDRNYWISQMQANIDQKEVIISFLKSEQFFVKSIVDGYKRRNAINNFTFTDEYNLTSLNLSH